MSLLQSYLWRVEGLKFKRVVFLKEARSKVALPVGHIERPVPGHSC